MMKKLVTNQYFILMVLLVCVCVIQFVYIPRFYDAEVSAYTTEEIEAKSSSRLLPEWMPKTWGIKLLKKMAKEKIRPGFEFSLEELNEIIGRISWIHSIDKIERDYKGLFNIRINIRKPICYTYIKSKKSNFFSESYWDDDGYYLKVLDQKNKLSLSDGTRLPAVDVSKLQYVSDIERNLWQKDLVSFLKDLAKRSEVLERYQLNNIILEPYKTAKYSTCLLKMEMFDKKFRSETHVEWGVFQKENALESRSNNEKWKDIKNAILREKHIRSLDLRYKPNSSFFN